MYSEKSIRRILEGDDRRLKDVLHIVRKARIMLEKTDYRVRICVKILRNYNAELLNLRRWLKELLKHQDIPSSVIRFLKEITQNVARIGMKLHKSRGSRRHIMKIVINAFADHGDKPIHEVVSETK